MKQLQLNLDIEIPPNPPAWGHSLGAVDSSSTVPTEKRVLMTHQQQGLEWAQTREHYGLLMEMRLGKTLTAIRDVQLRPESGGLSTPRMVLVVAPVTVLGAWEKELWLEGEYYVNVNQYKGFDARAGAIGALLDPRIAQLHPRRWVLINYEVLRQMPGLATELGWNFVILDESTRIKNPQAQITKICLGGFRTAQHRVILTGMVSPEGPLNLWSQFTFLHGSFMGCYNYWKYRSKYFIPDDYGHWTAKMQVLADLKHAVHEKSFITRRADVNIGQKKIYERRIVKLEPAKLKEYRKVERDLETSGGSETQWQIVVNTWLARMAGGFTAEGAEFHKAKITELIHLLCGELSAEKAVVWFRFNDELRAVAKACAYANIPACSIYGETKPEDRTRYLRMFSQPNLSSTRVLLCQEQCAKFGIDCSAADTAIYYSNWYSNEARSQSEDRIVHPTKKAPLLIVDLITEHTIDEDVVEVLNDKKADATAFMMRLRTQQLRRIARGG